jgi:hypothetical protein
MIGDVTHVAESCLHKLAVLISCLPTLAFAFVFPERCLEPLGFFVSGSTGISLSSEDCPVQASTMFISLEISSHFTYVLDDFLRLFRAHFVVRNLVFGLFDSFRVFGCFRLCEQL